MRAISTFPWEIRDTGLSFENPGSQATFLRGQKQNCGGRRNCEEPLAGSFRTATEEDSSGPTLLQKRDALHAGNLKAFAATHVLAHHHVVAPQHVRLRFGELGTVPLVGPRRQRLLLGAHQPLDLILGRLMAVRTTQVGRLLVRFFIKKFALIHKCWALGLINAATAPLIHVLLRMGGTRQPQIIALFADGMCEDAVLRPCLASARRKYSPPPRWSAKWPANAWGSPNPPAWFPRRRPNRRSTSPLWVDFLRMSSG